MTSVLGLNGNIWVHGFDMAIFNDCIIGSNHGGLGSTNIALHCSLKLSIVQMLI